MPLYEYECDACGHRFEKIQKFSDPLVEACPKCGGVVHKLMSSPAIQFKGSGFYITDYAKKDTKDTKDTKETKDTTGAKEGKESKESAATKESRDTKESTPAKETTAAKSSDSSSTTTTSSPKDSGKST
jgi:putative FmdB family regulatory protein